MTYKQRLDFLFSGRPEVYEILNRLTYDRLLNNQNRHNERIVMKLCILKLKNNSYKKIKRFRIKYN